MSVEPSPDASQAWDEASLLRPNGALSNRVTAVLFAVVGLITLGVVLKCWMDGVELWWPLALGPWIILLTSLAWAVSAWGTVVDLEGAKLRRWRRIGPWRRSDEWPLSSAQIVRVTAVNKGPGSSRYRMYVVELHGDRLPMPVWAGQELFEDAAVSRASQLASVLGIHARIETVAPVVAEWSSASPVEEPPGTNAAIGTAALTTESVAPSDQR